MSSLKGLEYEARVHGAAIQSHVNSLLASSGSGTETSAASAASAQSGGGGSGSGGSGSGSKAKAHIANAKKHIDDAMRGGGSGGEGGASMEPRVKRLEAENARMTAELKELRGLVEALSAKLAGTGLSNGPTKAAAAPVSAKKAEESEEEDSDPDLFGSDSEEEDDEEKAARKAKLLEAYAAKKAKKPGPIAKSSIIFDCKPWEAETDMAAMEASVRGVSMEGLIWGAAKLIPVAYGVKKLQIMATVEDEKVSVDELQERIEAFEDYVQSVDIAAFNKI